MAAKVDEDWSPDDLEHVLRLARTYLDESARCRDAESPYAAHVMLAVAFESVLLGLVVAYEDQVRERPTELWEHKKGRGVWQPSQITLTRLVKIAQKMSWITEPITEEVAEVLMKTRNMAVHPGAHVRGVRQIDDDFDLGDPAGYWASDDIIVRACGELFERVPRSTA